MLWGSTSEAAVGVNFSLLAWSTFWINGEATDLFMGKYQIQTPGEIIKEWEPILLQLTDAKSYNKCINKYVFWNHTYEYILFDISATAR